MLTKSIAILAISATLFGGAFAQGKKAAAPSCPVCHMTLAAKKSKANPIGVRLKKGGKVYYCCAGCKSKMPKSVIVK